MGRHLSTTYFCINTTITECLGGRRRQLRHQFFIFIFYYIFYILLYILGGRRRQLRHQCDRVLVAAPMRRHGAAVQSAAVGVGRSDCEASRVGVCARRISRRISRRVSRRSLGDGCVSGGAAGSAPSRRRSRRINLIKPRMIAH